MMPVSSARERECRSSAVTLSDMEIFIFPELLYSLVLANIMSPKIWRWREDAWFEGLLRKNPLPRINRLKQYIMDHYSFNLDLDTWGLTTKEKELARFKDFMDEETLSPSNALFGYEGDKYYFDMDIRRHFGLDKYEGNVIPYWKTETVEAMDAFRHKPGYDMGAGECVSLSTLYAAALFIVAEIPLKDIYLMATPLHSQNFIDVDEGILTNNRRLVTKTMWFNGTALSAQARRALENERVTMVAHESGHIHAVYGKATMDADAYARFSLRLKDYLKTQLSDEILCNFLRHDRAIQKCFQMRWRVHGVERYIPMERVFAYEHGSPYRLNDNTRDKLLGEVENEEFLSTWIKGRIELNDLEEFVKAESIDINKEEDVRRLKQKFASDCLNAEIAIEAIKRFCHVTPMLPDAGQKTFASDPEPLGIEVGMKREDILARLTEIRGRNVVADMAFHAYRDLAGTDPTPFLMAAVRRNPVSLEGSAGRDERDIACVIEEMPEESIYEGATRLAQPDEVWNYGRGDGLEKAILLANILRNRKPDAEIRIRTASGKAYLRVDGDEYMFPSRKRLGEQEWEIPGIG